MAAHGVVVRGDHARAYEHVVLDLRPPGDVRPALNQHARADDGVKIDHGSVPHDCLRADGGALPDLGMVADDRVGADRRARVNDRSATNRHLL